jgi:hypothetical protein
MSLCKKIIYALCLLVAIKSTAVVAQTCQTASIVATSPSNRFTVSNNGTVTDTKTGLMWKRCSEGLSGAACSVGTATAYTWQGALQRAQTVNNSGGYAGYANWRVPNVKELRSITERQCYGPAINAIIFPNTISDYYWSSSPVSFGSNDAWVVIFNVGNGI